MGNKSPWPSTPGSRRSGCHGSADRRLSATTTFALYSYGWVQTFRRPVSAVWCCISNIRNIHDVVPCVMVIFSLCHLGRYTTSRRVWLHTRHNCPLRHGYPNMSYQCFAQIRARQVPLVRTGLFLHVPTTDANFSFLCAKAPSEDVSSLQWTALYILRMSSLQMS